MLAAAPAILRGAQARRPNILFAISDDQSYPHVSAMGDRVVTMKDGRIAEERVNPGRRPPAELDW